MRKKQITLLAFSLICAFAALAIAVDGPLVKSGTGARTKAILGTVYYASLYVPQDMIGKSGDEIVNADKSMRVVMKIDTVLLSREKFVKSVSEGFDISASSGFTTDKKQAFLNLFSALEFKKGDIVSIEYTAGAATVVSFQKNGSSSVQILGTVPTLQFKKALFAIWIGPKPVEASLKNSMLGKK